MDIKILQKHLGVTFKDEELLQTALTHRSYINEHRKSTVENNERLEFLGDAVLELVVTEYLYATFEEPEGVLTNWRSALVKTESLSAAAKRLGLGDHVRLSRGERKGSKRARLQILANAVEAIIGAIYLDQGYDVAKSFIMEHIVSTLPEILQSGSWQDAKTKLQELVQEREGITPVYKVMTEAGPDHDKVFEVGAYVGKDLRGSGKGSSKQAAQQKAAEDALSRYTG